MRATIANIQENTTYRPIILPSGIPYITPTVKVITTITVNRQTGPPLTGAGALTRITVS